MAREQRAGGWVIRDGRWVLPGPSDPVVRRLPAGARAAEPETVEGEQVEREHPGTGEPMEAVEAAPDGSEHQLVVDDPDGPVRRACPDCGKPVPVNKSGTLRKHTCVIDADEPDVTFGE